MLFNVPANHYSFFINIIPVKGDNRHCF